MLLLALSQGAAFAHAAALGTMLGAISQALVCLAYGWLATHGNWPLMAPASVLVFVGATAGLQTENTLPAVVFTAVILALVFDLRLMHRAPAVALATTALARWDLAASMLVATSCLADLTGLAPIAGPPVTGWYRRFRSMP